MSEGRASGNTVPLIEPDWPTPAGVCAAVTTRHGGVSEGPYASFNLALASGDEPARVRENRRRLEDAAGVERIQWLAQHHGTEVLHVRQAPVEPPPAADALWTERRGLALAIQSADCLPVLICDHDATLVAAAHGGWRGLVAGVLAALVEGLPVAPGRLMAWLGPAIGACHYEVGDEVHDALWQAHGSAVAQRCCAAGRRRGRWALDLYALARLQLAELGVVEVHGGHFCSHGEARFYSYRRDGETGRMASLIWRD